MTSVVMTTIVDHGLLETKMMPKVEMRFGFPHEGLKRSHITIFILFFFFCNRSEISSDVAIYSN